jgi:hypothetical protein
MAESCKKKVAVGWRENKQNRKFQNCIFLGFFLVFSALESGKCAIFFLKHTHMEHGFLKIESL